MSEPCPLNLAAVEAAAARIRACAIETPFIESHELGRRLQARVFLKIEALQRTGSFKFRGAFNRLSQLSAAERTRGVAAVSSGNHAQAVAAAAAMIGTRAVIVMPKDAPKVKLERTRRLGAELVLVDRARDDRDAIATAIAAERSLAFVPPFDDYDVMAGQGTVGLEICRQADRLGIRLDRLLVPCSGGGLVAGTATAVASLSPETEVIAVEPEGFEDTGRSLAAGERVKNAAAAGSLCDALLVPMPGRLTFPINRRLLSGAVAASDEEVRAAITYAFSDLRLVLEPSGAIGLAPLLAGRLDVAGKSVAVVLSGGNVDGALFASLI